MSSPLKPPFRADHVGSLLRPAALHDARAKARSGEIDRAALKSMEDRCIKDVIALQETIGIQSVTDGEFRRSWWHVDFLCGFDGVETTAPNYGKAGFKDSDEQPPFMKVARKLKRTKPIMVDHFAYLKANTRNTAKFCLPSPAMLHLRGDRAALKATYPDENEFWADLTAGYQAEISDLAAAGCTYLQVDDTSIATLCDETVRGERRNVGDDPDQLSATYAKAVNMAIARRPPGMTVTVHTCRGNFKSTWMASGSYDAVADTVFNQLQVDGFFLEYDDARSGGFEPLRFVPKGKKVVLGLVSTKVPLLEKKDELKRRIDEASKYVALENLCVSPQCGFASTHHGNNLTQDDERRKLELLLELAREVWGSA
jgi:5-methyltetrahydropteroyltriglutamate--homocysteine methyltransferase